MDKIIEKHKQQEILRNNAVNIAEQDYHDACEELNDELKEVAPVKIGDTVRILNTHKHYKRLARVDEIGFLENDRYQGRGRIAGAKVTILKNDGSDSAYTTVYGFQSLEVQ